MPPSVRPSQCQQGAWHASCKLSTVSAAGSLARGCITVYLYCICSVREFHTGHPLLDCDASKQLIFTSHCPFPTIRQCVSMKSPTMAFLTGNLSSAGYLRHSHKSRLSGCSSHACRGVDFFYQEPIKTALRNSDRNALGKVPSSQRKAYRIVSKPPDLCREGFPS